MASDVPAHRFHPAFELRIGEELIRRGDMQGATLAFQRLGEGADGNLTPELATRCGRLSERPGLSDELRRELERLGEKAGEVGPLGEPRASVAGRPDPGWRAPHVRGAGAE